MKKDRIPELIYFEFRLLAWATSETRVRLDATGRGIYLELLFQCYAQGSFPDDPEYIKNKCACTQEQYEKWWPFIRRKFIASKHEKNVLENKLSNIFRRNYFGYIRQQKNNRKNGIEKYKGMKQMQDGGSTVGSTVVQPIRYDTIRHDTKAAATRARGTPPTAFDAKLWPQTAATVRSHFPATDDAAISLIVAASVGVHPAITDEQLAVVIEPATRPNQRSAKLYCSTVPEVIRSCQN